LTSLPWILWLQQLATSGQVAEAVAEPHAFRHSIGGADQLNVTGLSGVLSDAQTPAAHASSHQNGEVDEVSIDESQVAFDVAAGHDHDGVDSKLVLAGGYARTFMLMGA
jgi:hypothetical protein